ncbi:hypothetical protein JTB14_028222 [Gonioctena quinquepunctata]|nr:hypothetical protein JTB14_028222 [Gonioctena quinquepunctata]
MTIAFSNLYIFFSRALTLEEGLQVAHADNLDVGDIYIEPPEPAELTDEDSADEDGGGLVDNLSANQLQAAAEISIYQQDNTDDNEIISEALEEPEKEPQPVNSVEKNYYSNISWINGDIVCNEKHFFFRIPRGCPLPRKQTLQKQPREEYATAMDMTYGTILIRWNDNSIVTLASTEYGANPSNHVKRFSQAEKSNIQIEVPLAIAKYNSLMGGTDLMNENTSRHRISI